MAAAGNVCTPSFPSREDLDQLRTLCSASAGAWDSTSGGGAVGTPAAVKRGVPAASASTPGGSTKADPTAQAQAQAPPPLGVDELAILAGDVQCLEAWLEAEFSTAAASALVMRGAAARAMGSGSAGADGAGAVDLKAVDAVRRVLQAHTVKLRGAREAVWARVGAVIGECPENAAAFPYHFTL